VAAITGALGAALGAMVANLSANKRGWDSRWEEFSNWAVKAEGYRRRLLELVDADTRAYEKIMQALQMPKSSPEQQTARHAALHEATKGAILVPLETLRVCVESMEVSQAMAKIGMPSSVSDAGVGVMCARTGALAAYLNVRTNFQGFDGAAFKETVMAEAEALKVKAERMEAEVLEATLAKL
jgi:glutamate formiminotransferase/formiminotetrahydrofolate cyclodeaminase